MNFVLKNGAKKVLILGCGGGYDVYSGLPLYWDLQRLDIEVHLANHSFSEDLYLLASPEDSALVCIPANIHRTPKNKAYFPEAALADYLNKTVYAFRLLSANDIYKGLLRLLTHLNFTPDDVIICVDAGHDAVLFGDEKVTGSPMEDVTMVLALQMLMGKYTVHLACISAPTETMDFKLFLQQYELIKGVQPVIQANPDHADILQALLDTTSEKTRSIPNEALLASMRLLQNKPSEFMKRISGRAESEGWTSEDYPAVLPETSLYYFIDFRLLLEKSPFYRYILEHFKKEMQPRDLNGLIAEAFKILATNL